MSEAGPAEPPEAVDEATHAIEVFSKKQRLIMGGDTFGKGSVQTIVPIDDRTAERFDPDLAGRLLIETRSPGPVAGNQPSRIRPTSRLPN